MGVPGLWRILDLASKPLDFEQCSGLRIAIDIHSHVNRLVHSQSSSSWIYLLARSFFRILHFNIRIVVVFLGRRPIEKLYSNLLDDESTNSSYYRVRSLLLRANQHLEEPSEEDQQKKPTEPIPEVFQPIFKNSQALKEWKRFKTNIDASDDINTISQRQIEAMSKAEFAPCPQMIQHSTISGNYVFFEKGHNKNSSANFANSEVGVPRKDLEITMPKDLTVDQFHSSFLDDIDDILKDEDPSSEGVSPSHSQEPTVNAIPISLLPDDNPYLPPIENYITADHIRLIEQLCDCLGIPYVHAPEEACAECARLEQQGLVDAVASDDNNAILFGSKWIIRGIFTKPQSITVKTLENVGMNRERMIMMAMMIDGDYNADIRKRLFTVGPVRGMEIISLFPEEEIGLYKFKEWWIRVVKEKKLEDNPALNKLAHSKYIKKLIMPDSFPPMELYNALRSPVVGDERPIVTLPTFDPEEAIKFITNASLVNMDRVREITMSFSRRIKTFSAERTLFNYTINGLEESKRFQPYFDRLILFDQRKKREAELSKPKSSENTSDKEKAKKDQPQNSDENEEDEFETVSEPSSDANNEEEDQDSIEEA